MKDVLDYADFEDIQKLFGAKVIKIEKKKTEISINDDYLIYIYFSNGLILTSECREYCDNVFYFVKK